MIDFIKRAMTCLRSDLNIRPADADLKRLLTVVWQTMPADEHDQLKLAGLVQAALLKGANPNLNVDIDTRPVCALMVALSRKEGEARSLMVRCLLDAGADPFTRVDPVLGGSMKTCSQFVCDRGDVQSLVAILQTPVAQSERSILQLHDMAKFAALSMSSTNPSASPAMLQALQDHFEAHAMKADPSLSINALWARPVPVPMHERDFGVSIHQAESLMSDDGMNVFMLAARNGRAEAIAWMLEHPNLDMGRHIDTKNANGHTALWNVCLKPSLLSAPEAAFESVIKTLIFSGADAYTTDSMGRKLLDVMEDSRKIGVSGSSRFDLVKSLVSVKEARDAIDRVMENDSVVSTLSGRGMSP